MMRGIFFVPQIQYIKLHDLARFFMPAFMPLWSADIGERSRKNL